jgi:hypothetical protein
VIAPRNSTGIEFQHDAVLVEATVVAEGLGVAASLLPALVRSGEVTSLCERRVGDAEGR